MVHRLPSQGAYERLEPYAGKPASTVLRGEWCSNAPFLPDKPANGNGAPPANGEPAATGAVDPSEDSDPIPF